MTMATSDRKLDDLPSCSTLSSCSDSESGVCKCKDKVENYKIIIKNLEQELNSTKVRREGVETIAKLLMEARQEIAVLNKKNKQLETRVHELQSRLERNNLPSNLQQDESEIYVPQTSKQILDNLTRENSRLRNLLRQCTVNPDEIEKQRQSLIEKTEQLQDVKNELSHKQHEVEHLEQVLSASTNEKDRFISEYQETIKKIHQGSKVQDVVCRSLSEESSSLRQQLKDVAVTCQTLAMKLEESEKLTKGISEKSPDVVSSLQFEVRKLQARNQEISEMNKKWQNYNEEQQNKMRLIESRNCELGKQLGNSDGVMDTQKEANLLIVKSRERIEKMKGELQVKTNECDALRNEMQKLHEENRQLRINQTNQNYPGEGDVDALKVQIQILTEDFEQERMDRERAHTKLDNLQQENQKLMKENHTLKMNQQATLQQQTAYQQQMLMNRFISPVQQYNPRMPGDAGLVARGKLTTDNAEMQPRNPPSPNNQGGLQQNFSKFSCPKCGKEYLVDQHNQLLDHIAQCCE